MNLTPTKNHLQYEKSLYLQQHASNPIAWFPWSDEAFEKAKNENKLLFISIGYSSCHWCHVMEKEVFEKQETADFLNEFFVCIKVDREERPDIDATYMTAVQLMTQSGGWPLNCFTLPDGRPIYGGTYFPLPHFMNIVKQLNDLFVSEPQKLYEYAESLVDGMQTANVINTPENTPFDSEKLHNLIERWASRFDWQDGGMKRAPKFPMPNNYDFLLTYSKYFSEEAVVSFVHLTLHKIIRGGIYDHLEGGLMRYSTDMHWKEPHFEKMLYDNGQFLSVVAKAQLDNPSLEYQLTLEQTVQWLENKMKDENGFFKSSIDADADNEEGSYYVWKKEELQTILDAEFQPFENLYEINGNGFWKDGNYILLRQKSFDEFIENQNINSNQFTNWFNKINTTLLAYRKQRIAPIIDDKIIFSWNCMTAIGLLDVALALQDDIYFDKILTLTAKLEQQFTDETHIYRINDGSRKINGFLDDYAFYIRLCIQLHQYTLAETWLEKAVFWLERITEIFGKQNNLFYYSETDNLLITKTIETEDNVIPSSNSVLANCFWDLGVIHSNETWLNTAIQMLQCVQSGMENYGSGYSNWAILLHKILKGDLLVNYLGKISSESHLQQLRRLHDIALFKSNAQFEKENTFEICHLRQCKLPVVGFEQIFENVKKVLS